MFALVDHRSVGGGAQPAGGEHPGEGIRRTHLGKGHRPTVDDVDDRSVGVVQDHVEPGLGKSKTQGQADMPTPPDNDNVVLELHRSPHLRGGDELLMTRRGDSL